MSGMKRYFVRNGNLLDEQADAMYVRRHEVYLATDADATITALRCELAEVRANDALLLSALKDLKRAYVAALDSGRQRIIELGGQCDPLDVMERGDPYLAKARIAIDAQLALSPSPASSGGAGEGDDTTHNQSYDQPTSPGEGVR